MAENDRLVELVSEESSDDKADSDFNFMLPIEVVSLSRLISPHVNVFAKN